MLKLLIYPLHGWTLSLSIIQTFAPPERFCRSRHWIRVCCVCIGRYYGLYDTADRKGLLKKYYKDALITIYTPSESSLGEEGTDKPTPEDSPQLKCERLTAEDFIKELTHKHHDMSSFTTTVSRGTDTQVNFTVHGFFKEIKNCQESVKIFWRVVQLVPTMDGR
ncbi:nuclear RNA export factor 1-like [Lampetra fluviatilis]